MKEFTIFGLMEALTETWDLHETGLRNAVEKMNVWLRRGDGIAVYVNNDLGNAEAGYRQYVSYGSPAAQLEVAEPPEQLPDVGGSLGWRYQLEGTFRGVPLPVPMPSTFEGTTLTYTTQRFTVQLDNHEPARRLRTGTLRRFTGHNGEPSIEIPWATVTLGKDAYKSIYLVDDGKTVVPYHVSGERKGADAEQERMWLKAFPVNPDGKTRPDNGEVIDYSGLMFGPRKAFHLKVED